MYTNTYTVAQASYSIPYTHVYVYRHINNLYNTHRYMMMSRVMVLGFVAVETKTLSFLC